MTALALPTTAAQVAVQVWWPAMALLPARMGGRDAALLGLAIGGQESGYRTRVQDFGGPAHSFWQMEQGGGVRGVLTHPATRDAASRVCAARGVNPDPAAVWAAMAQDDLLGAAFARLLLWSDPRPLPAPGDSEAAWAYYVGLWRPGKPDKARWPAAYHAAQAALTIPATS